jgi:hypothetical protein
MVISIYESLRVSLVRQSDSLLAFSASFACFRAACLAFFSSAATLVKDAALIVLIKPLHNSLHSATIMLVISKATLPLSRVDVVLMIESLISFDGYEGVRS